MCWRRVSPERPCLVSLGCQSRTLLGCLGAPLMQALKLEALRQELVRHEDLAAELRGMIAALEAEMERGPGPTLGAAARQQQQQQKGGMTGHAMSIPR